MMPDVFIYCADIYCSGCGSAIKRDLDQCPSESMLRYGDTAKEDSNYYPQGPYADGGGEADCPQHCGACAALLRNPLTGDGESYVRAAVDDAESDGEMNGALIEWRDYYSYLWESE